MIAQVWKTELLLPDEATADAFGAAVDGFVLGQATFEAPDGAGAGPAKRWSLEFYTDGMPDWGVLGPRIALAAAECGVAEPEPHAAPLPEIDWVAENQKSFSPIRAGRFYVHQEFSTENPPPGAVELIVNAGTAFGTGTHATTRACLLMLDALLKRTRPRNALDLGCGTGILAMGLARTTHRPVAASDIDPEAVRVAAENARLNGLAAYLRPVTAAGLQDRRLRAGGPYDLIVANILAKPLRALAPAIARACAPGGRVILSGLLIEQEAMVLNAYRTQGLRLLGRRRIDGWSALLLAG
ncbi:MAG: 50S ribosomal protein L11 methyltransferase [Marivibrio sp.]|uniref:50S ribosomal protein L11 methyltransferase n=1 Tax=Marivibrio sp. TaxID=2039719 RepID=UPI0032EFB63A